MDRNGASSLPELGTVRETGGRNTSLLRVGVLFLSLVSFFTTANGMRSYIFTDNGGVAYAASAAIQSILLALSMNLPRYIQDIWNSGRGRAQSEAGDRAPEDRFTGEPSGKTGGEGAQSEAGDRAPENQSSDKAYVKFGRWLADHLPRFFLCSAAITLTLVTIMCSSWFSYVYIADVIHKDSWNTDSQLLVQQTYRAELYNARDYAHAYRTYLEERVGENILQLENQARTIADSSSSVTVDWEQERSDYLSDGGTAASYMSPVIPAMTDAMREGATQDDRDLAATVIATAKANIENRIEAVQANLNRINLNLANYDSQISNLTARVNAATAETDVASLNESINNLTGLINQNTQQQISLQQENAQLDQALMRLPFYESLLGLTNSTSSISIRAQLIEMQTEFFKTDPDSQVLLDTAANIFDNLRSAASTITSSGEENEDGGTSQNEFSYTNLLVQMNRMIRNLRDYAEIKAIEANLDELIASLRTVSEEDQSNPEPDGTVPEENEPNPAPAGSDQEGQNAGQGGENAGQGEADQPDTNTAGGKTPRSAAANNSAWKQEWSARLEALKAQISAMPMYSEAEETGTTDSGRIEVLTSSQRGILRGFDRNESSAALDDMVRRYLSNHNAIYQGIIYLTSPYRMLAVFALCLALSFDLSGFVFGVIMQGEPRQNERADGRRRDGPACHAAGTVSSRVRQKGGQTEWSILDHLHQYRVLTGSFSHRDGVFYYHVFRDGLAEKLPVKGTEGAVPYRQGIYVLTQSRAGQIGGVGEPDAWAECSASQELRYSGQAEGPRDGVFMNCRLIYKEGGLSKLEPDGPLSFICSLDEYVPIHTYSPAGAENRTFPVKQIDQRRPLDVKTAVVALNKSGTRVSAVYAIMRD